MTRQPKNNNQVDNELLHKAISVALEAVQKPADYYKSADPDAYLKLIAYLGLKIYDKIK